MAMALAERKATDLVTVAPDAPAYRNCSLAVERIVSRYAPAFQSDVRGNWYLDITGTTGLFGTPVDCASRVLKEIASDTGLYPAAAAAGNKPVGKVATRTIRPMGLIHIRRGDEAAFLAHQDIRLLPGLGPSLLRTLASTGFREIGELAVLGEGEALALFGRRGLMLRDTARGMDDSRVLHTADGEGAGPIERRLDFEEDVIDFEVIRGALAYLAENAGVAMRKEKLGARKLSLAVLYADGITAQGERHEKRPVILDREIREAAEQAYRRIAARRIRVRGLSLALGDLRPLGWEPDLFVPEGDERQRRIQESADTLRGRYGINAVTRGLVLAASRTTTGIALPSPMAGYAY
jgi:DNA polymerase-4